MFYIYNLIVYEPILNFVVWLYNIIPSHDLGLVILIITLLIRVILFPLTHKMLKNAKEMQKIQPALNELKEKHKDDKTAHTQALMAFYKENKINPFSSCLPLLIQLPILIALYTVFQSFFNNNLEGLYTFVYKPETINTLAFGFFDIAKSFWPVAVLAGVLQFWLSKISITMPAGTSSDGTDLQTKILNYQMMYFIPVFTVYITWYLPSGLGLYWIITTAFAIGQQYLVNYIYSNKK